MKYAPHHYQEKAIRFMLERACAGLFLDPGMGKTSITYAAFEVLRHQGLVNRMLVLAPLRVCYSTWPAEAKKWSEFSHLKVGVLHGPDKKAVLEGDYDVLVINYEGLKWLEAQKCVLPEMLVIDESSKVKNVSTQRFKVLKKLIQRFRRRYILTGSPAANGLMDLFGQVYAMDQGATFGPYITHFRNEFFFQTGFGGYEWKLKPGAEKAIHERLAPRVMRLDAKDYLELPPLVEVTVEVELPPDARKLYDQMETQLMVLLGSDQVTASNAAVATMKCRQIAAGGLYNDAAAKTFINLHSAKADAVADLVDELEGQPALVAYDFKHDLDRLRAVLGAHVPHIGGGVSAAQSQSLVDQWNAGELPVLLGHPQSMSHGLNMQESGRAIIFHSLPWSWEDRMQFIRRVWRQGQAGRVFVYNIVAKDTVDEAVMHAIRRKATGEGKLLDALRDYWKARK